MVGSPVRPRVRTGDLLPPRRPPAAEPVTNSCHGKFRLPGRATVPRPCITVGPFPVPFIGAGDDVAWHRNHRKRDRVRALRPIAIVTTAGAGVASRFEGNTDCVEGTNRDDAEC